MSTNEDIVLARLVRDPQVVHFQGKRMMGSITLTTIEKKQTPSINNNSMIGWQLIWKNKFKDGLTFYFDLQSLLLKNNNLKKINNLQINNLKKKILQNGGKIVPIIPNNKSNENLIIISNNLSLSNGTDINKKIWNLSKLSRFFQNFELNLNQYVDSNEQKNLSSSQSSLQYSNDVIYFNNSPHIYLYDTKQRYRPLICKQWDVALVNKSGKDQLPYPHIQRNSDYGNCPFKPMITKNRSNNNNDLVALTKKRYTRDLVNQRYALKLRKTYQRHARPPKDLKNIINDLELQGSVNQELYDYFNHDCQNSKKLMNSLKFLELKRFNTMDINFKSFNENVDPMVSLKTDLIMAKHNSSSTESESSSGSSLDNDSLGSNDTVETLAFSELSDDHEPRTSLLQLTQNASMYDEQYDETVVNTGFRPLHKSIELRNNKKRYCENCHQVYTDTLRTHILTETHKLNSMDETKFIEIDKLIKLVKT